MDIICPRCGEPFDMDELHYINDPDMREADRIYGTEHLLSYKQAYHIFQTKGCGVLLNDAPCPVRRNMRTAAATAFMDMLGDDVDGVAAMLEDEGLT
jgi:hypothetical protein